MYNVHCTCMNIEFTRTETLKLARREAPFKLMLGGISHSLTGSAGVRADVGDDSRTVSPVGVNDSSEGTGNVHVGQSGLDLSSSEGGSREESSGDEAGGGDEEREEGPVDGVIGSTRLGKERQLSQIPLGFTQAVNPDITYM